MLVVEDAANDERFAANPLVTGEPFIRFYAGAPFIVRDEIRLGTVCIIDKVPRTLSFDQKIVLKQLAKIAMEELKKL